MRTRTRSFILFFVLALGSGLWSCKSDSSPTSTDTPQYTDTLIVKFHPHFNEDHLFLGQPYVDSVGETLVFSKVKFYCSEISLVSASGKETKLDGMALVDFGDSSHVIDGHYYLHIAAPTGTYSGIKFTVGVPYADNHQDAATQAFPLGPNSDMYWSWNPGYVFMKLEGTADNGSGPVGFAWHIGGDSYAQRVSIAKFGTGASTFDIVKGTPYTFGVECNFHKLFQIGLTPGEPMNISKNPSERQLHGTPVDLANRLYDNSIGMFAPED